MNINIYQIDAFTSEVFGGNSAAVCPLKEWLGDNILQDIAMENNLSETAFYVKEGNRYNIRWFTPTLEVDLCGHATLATAFVLFHLENHEGNTIHFYSEHSGELTVTKQGDLLTLNFPEDLTEEIELSQDMLDAFDLNPVEAYKGKSDLLLVYEHENDIKNLKPYFDKVGKLDCRGVIVSARGDTVDFVSRFFTPQCGINEDPVTGSAHTTLTPFWSKKLGKLEMTAIQLSDRRGYLKCKYVKPRVEISGHGKLYMSGTINIK
ncbi:PhzF family phenazine biosynthesis protein [Winogradskyella alexanderae]|uniref:PhzF family phenazine biosynthesis protein n=1 Tax=Winogradskyella alexanderae TaxID=2877123 RepID=A0ABS7XUK5_9FLAO|nr:PhzF family phenazine biosynthesis protein [Winogradskyella alexanderae]MCA0133707.1 PhzF family phenazine biosynthesis protein [Winogradskyella alexanderae]